MARCWDRSSSRYLILNLVILGFIAGLLYFRHGPNTTRFLEGWHESLEKDEKTWDQNAFNWLVHDGLQPFKSHPSNPRLVSMGGEAKP